jgi:hypothetical protein
MSITTGGTEMIGGYPTAFGGAGGIGGLGLVGLIGLNSLWGNKGFGDANGGSIVANTVADQNISELRKDVQGVNTTVEALGNEMQMAFAQQTQGINADFRNLDNQICGVEKTLLQQSYAQSLQAFQNTQAIQNQVTAFQVANDKEFCAIKSQISADGDATRALINQNLIDGLRAELAAERRNSDQREIAVTVTQTNQQTQNQLQAQLQNQSQYIANALNMLGDQVNKANNSIVNLGGTITGTGQHNNQANTKVNA